MAGGKTNVVVLRNPSKDIIVTQPKPEHLYAWTDNELTDTTYYAWYNPSSDSIANRRIFSLYENPKINDTVWVFSYNANRTSYDISEATETTIISTVPGTGAVNSVALNSNGTLYLQTFTMGGITCERASSWDMTVANPLKTVYTDSTTLTEGMTMYDNTGSDTGYQVSKISNSNFELGQYSVSFVISNMVTNFTLDGITYTTNTTLKLSEGTHSLSITGTYVSLRIQSTGGGSSVTVISGGSTSGNYTGSLIISSGNITESTQNYLFGTCPITLTFEGSMNSGGGSN